MIEQLHEQAICDSDGAIYGMRAPDNFELMWQIGILMK